MGPVGRAPTHWRPHVAPAGSNRCTAPLLHSVPNSHRCATQTQRWPTHWQERATWASRPRIQQPQRGEGGCRGCYGGPSAPVLGTAAARAISLGCNPSGDPCLRQDHDSHDHPAPLARLWCLQIPPLQVGTCPPPLPRATPMRASQTRSSTRGARYIPSYIMLPDSQARSV